MFEFDKLCKEIEKIPFDEYAAILTVKTAQVLPALESITINGISGIEIFGSFILASIVADGKLSEEEYLLLYPSMQLFFQDSLRYEDCKEVVKKAAPEVRELKKIVNEMVDVIGMLSEELKSDIITISLLICAVDGKISFKEKQYIKQLIKD
ncbi:MAG: hypothetical protein K6G51_04295 [Sphaerochaetaceae bacterium]|nr:hypothetical protein [Sphaerochaetaceae bacterium]